MALVLVLVVPVLLVLAIVAVLLVLLLVTVTVLVLLVSLPPLLLPRVLLLRCLHLNDLERDLEGGADVRRRATAEERHEDEVGDAGGDDPCVSARNQRRQQAPREDGHREHDVQGADCQQATIE